VESLYITSHSRRRECWERMETGQNTYSGPLEKT